MLCWVPETSRLEQLHCLPVRVRFLFSIRSQLPELSRGAVWDARNVPGLRLKLLDVFKYDGLPELPEGKQPHKQHMLRYSCRMRNPIAHNWNLFGLLPRLQPIK